MEYQKKPSSSTTTARVPVLPTVVPQITPAQQAQRDADQQRTQQWRSAQALFTFTGRPVDVQRQAIRPVLTAASLERQETQRVDEARPALQGQVQELEQTYPPAAVQAAIQRQQQRTTPTPVIRQPQSTADWVTVMRQQAEQTEGRVMQSSGFEDVKALQRQVAQRLATGYRQDRQAPAARTAEYAGHLVALQHHPVSAQVAHAVMTQIPQGERPALQRAVDEALQREADQQAQDAQATGLPALQRQLAELDEEATQPVMQRIQARRGAGSPLPEAVQRHLEQGLNHDLGAVRIHDDAEADRLAKGVNATAFTTGTDIFFRAGRFQPNSRSGLELLAHEVTHTVQQSRGRVGRGIDPDAGLEAEARTMGARFAQGHPPVRLGALRAAPALAPRSAGGGFVVQRQAAGTTPGLKMGEADFWTALPGAILDGARQSLVDIWELIKNLPVITRQLPEVTQKALAWLRTMDTVQEWKAVAQALGMGALMAGQAWLRQTAAVQGRSVGVFLGKLVGEIALGKGAGAVLKSLKGGGSIVQVFETFTRKVDDAIQQLNRGPGRPALAVPNGGRVPTPPRPGSTTNAMTARPRPGASTGGGRVTPVPDPRDVAVNKLLGQVPANFATVRDLIGKPLDTSKLPKTDYYTKQMGGVTVIVRKTADDKRFTPLRVDANGRVQVNITERISNPNLMRKNFKGTWGTLTPGHWIHHLIPDTLIRNHPVGQALQKLGYDLDRGSNLLGLAGKDTFNANVDVVGHWTDHQKYTIYVRSQLEALKSRYAPLDGMTPVTGQSLLKDIKTLEDDLRTKIKNNFFEKRPDGSLASSGQGKGSDQA